MKIAIYGISKNEEKFVERWAKSAQESDGIFLLDTGSTDTTVDIAIKNGVLVQTKEIIPWRFDVARNASLNMIPEDYDVAICLDLDEILVPGWRQKLEASWNLTNIDRLRYKYVWSWIEPGKPDLIYYADKIHSLKSGFVWINPVHEVLSLIEKRNEIQVWNHDDILIEHHPDSAKSRSQYLPLLELAVQELPDDDRNVHYLAREYFFHSRYEEAIDLFKRHITLSNWNEEMAFSKRYISQSYFYLGNKTEALRFALDACYTASLRETWVWLAQIFFSEKNWYGLIWAFSESMKIDINSPNYFNERNARNHYMFDMVSVAFTEIGHLNMAEDAIKNAIKLCDNEKDRERLKKNLEWVCTNKSD